MPSEAQLWKLLRSLHLSTWFLLKTVGQGMMEISTTNFVWFVNTAIVPRTLGSIIWNLYQVAGAKGNGDQEVVDKIQGGSWYIDAPAIGKNHAIVIIIIIIIFLVYTFLMVKSFYSSCPIYKLEFNSNYWTYPALQVIPNSIAYFGRTVVGLQFNPLSTARFIQDQRRPHSLSPQNV